MSSPTARGGRMRPILHSALSFALLLLAHSAHAGEGVNLRWDECHGDAGAQNMSFACDTNIGTETLVASFLLGANLAHVLGTELLVDVATSSATLPPWWALRNPGSCRFTSLSMNTTISTNAVNCVDWANELSTGGIAGFQIGVRGPNTVRIVIATAGPDQFTVDLAAGTEYFACNIRINNLKTVGSGACAGCNVPACLVASELLVETTGSANDRTLTGPGNGTDSDFALWQGGGNPIVGGVFGCPAATPTRRSNWGVVKSLYR